MAFVSSYDDELVLYLDRTSHITPGVLCDLLTFFKYQKTRKGATVLLVFGNATKLRSYLDDTQFFLHSEHGNLFITDIVYHYSSDLDIRRRHNTNKIHRVNVPLHSISNKIYLPYSVQNEFHRSVLELYNSYEKQRAMKQLKLDDYEKLAGGFSEIIENAYGYGYTTTESCFYFSFQNYKKTGISLACSDSGGGYYNSVLSKLYYVEEKNVIESPQLRKIEIKLPLIPKLFTKNEFLSFKNDTRRRNLAAILECILIHIDDRLNGFPYILSTLVLHAGGNLHIHSENTLINISREFLSEYFVVSNGVISGFNKTKLRGIVLNLRIQDKLIQNGTLQVYSHFFPGVHISVEIGGQESNGKYL
ncbi:hypothetical protein JRC49_09585 [Clostridiales bacterium FE2011]|nr:hypothetical protein JRC49_09585 [Clostridiales bacterium FE2011]